MSKNLFNWPIAAAVFVVMLLAFATELSAAPSESQKVVGLTVLVNFSDEKAIFTKEAVEEFLNKKNYAGPGGSVYDYFYDVSNGLFEYTNIVTPFVTLDSNKAYYDAGDGEFVLEVLDKLTKLIGENFDLSGVTTKTVSHLPGRNVVSALNILYAGSRYVNGNKSALWPSVGDMYQKREFTIGGKTLYKYQLTDLGTGNTPPPLGVFVHETAHVLLGWSDLYESTATSRGYVGEWCAMGITNDLYPQQPNPYYRSKAGWIDEIDITNAAPGTQFSHRANSPSAYVYRRNNMESYFIEARRKTTAAEDPRNYSLNASGLAIWRIHTEGSNKSATKPEVVLIKAEETYPWGGPTDLFRQGVKTEFNRITDPAALYHDGEASDINIVEISDDGEVMTFIIGKPVSEYVSNIAGIPTVARVGTLALKGVIIPSNVVNRTIVWNISSSSPAANARISGDTLYTTGEGRVTLWATVANGNAVGGDYTQTFDIDLYINQHYVITGSGARFNATRNGMLWGMADQPIQNVIDAIKGDCREECIIQFGDYVDVLDVGNSSIMFNGSEADNWGNIILSGKVKSSSSGTINIKDIVSVKSYADIQSAGGTALTKRDSGFLEIINGRISSLLGTAIEINNSGDTSIIIGGTISGETAIRNYNSLGSLIIVGGVVSVTGGGTAIHNQGPSFNSFGSLTISGGTVSANTGNAINNGYAKVTISGTAQVTSINANTENGTVYSRSLGIIEILGGTVSNYAPEANAIFNDRYNADGLLVLGGNPTINGLIAGFHAERVSVHTLGANTFYRGNKKYLLAPATLVNGDIAVIGGANYIRNFTLYNPDFVLIANGNNAVVQQIAKWQSDIKKARSGDVIVVPPGIYTVYENLIIPETSTNVTLQFQPGTELNFTERANEIWAGTTGSIVGVANLKLSHDIRVYNTDYPRDPASNDKIIGLFSNLCDALYRGRGGRTVKVGPGIYSSYISVEDQGFIGTKDPSAPRDPTKNSIIRATSYNYGPSCNYKAPEGRSGSTVFTKDMRFEFDTDSYVHTNDVEYVVSGDGPAVFDGCIFEGVTPLTKEKNITVWQLGSASSPLSGGVEFRSCTFRNLGTAVYVNHPMLPEQSPTFENCIFDNNSTDLKFNEGSRAFCGLNGNRFTSVLVGQKRYTVAADINDLKISSCPTTGILESPRIIPQYQNYSVSDPDFVDPLASDFRLTSASPMIAAGTDLKDIGAQSRDAVFTFSSFLDGRVEFGGGQMAQLESGMLTNSTVGAAATLRFHYAQNLRPVYELKLRGDFINKPSTVTVWKNPKVPAPSLPDEYVIWDASVNGVRFAELNNIELPASGSISKNVIPKTVAPAPVSGINTVQESNDVVLTWNRNTEPDMARYKIFRAPAAVPNQVTQIASLPAGVTEYKDANQTAANNAYSIVAYDSTGNMSAYVGGNKIFSFFGFDAYVRDTLRVTSSGVTVQIDNPDYLHGAMITVRNRGQNDSLIVDWYGCTDQNNSGCMEQSKNLFGNGAQINNFVSPKLGNGTILVNIRSATGETYLADIEIFNWRNGSGCR